MAPDRIPLTGREERIWQAYLDATTLLKNHLDRRLRCDAEMRQISYAILAQLAQAPQQRLRMAELAERARTSPSRTSHAVARLEGSGWVRRELCDADRRGQFAVLTEKGHDVLTRATPLHAAAVRQGLLGRLSLEQQHCLGEIMRIVAEGLLPTENGPDR